MFCSLNCITRGIREILPPNLDVHHTTSPLLSFLLSFVFANFLLAAFSADDKVLNPIKEFAGSQVSYGLLYHMFFIAIL